MTHRGTNKNLNADDYESTTPGLRIEGFRTRRTSQLETK